MHKVIGVEISPDAIDDAGINAKVNKIANAEFLVGKAEKRLKHILRGIPSTVEAPVTADAAPNNATADAATNSTVETPVTADAAPDSKSADTADAATNSTVETAVTADAAPNGKSADTADAATNSTGEAPVTADAATTSVTDTSSIDRSSDVVAIVDPPRPGLHKDCIKAILKCHALKKLVYVSCNPTKAFLDDIVALCRPPVQTDLQVRASARLTCVHADFGELQRNAHALACAYSHRQVRAIDYACACVLMYS